MKKPAILCVDDEKIILDSLKRQLKEQFGERFIYEVAENADEAYEIIQELEEDGTELIVIVSDWLMPGIKGDEFLIRIHQKYPQIVKIMLTGQANPESVERAKQQANLLCCLYKPWTVDELTDVINKGLKLLN